MNRRDFLYGAAAAAAGMALGAPADADVSAPFDWDLWPPTAGREAFVAWMREKRGED